MWLSIQCESPYFVISLDRRSSLSGVRQALIVTALIICEKDFRTGKILQRQ